MLSLRLKAVADMVTPGKIVADIGTDHGYVPIYLIENEIVPYAYAMDINEGPVLRAKQNIEDRGLADKISVIKSNGMEKLTPDMAQSVVIAGMGGELIIQILKESKVMNNLDELVLSPHRRVDLVRSYLLEKGWSIVEETMVKDMDKYYTIMKVIPVSESVAYSKSEMIYGRILLNDRNEILKEYLDKEYHKFMNILTAMKENGNTNTEEIEQKN